MRLVNAMPLLLCGCAVHAVGFVKVTDGTTALLLPDGREKTLALLDEESEPLHLLDGWMLELDGHQRVSSLRVRSWRAIEGPHGIAAWVGPVQTLGNGVGILDRASNAVYRLDDASAAELKGLPGALVAAEAWVVGPQTLQVLHLTILDP
jgi:hypothetical protein